MALGGKKLKIPSHDLSNLISHAVKKNTGEDPFFEDLLKLTGQTREKLGKTDAWSKGRAPKHPARERE